MKIKNLFLTLALAFALFSCSTDDNEKISAESQSTTTHTAKIMEFSSVKEMDAKIAEVIAYNSKVDSQLVDQSFSSDLSNTLNNTADKSSKVLSEEAKNKMLEELNVYHSAKLEAIYESRRHFNFTSIQSIADEINSLRLINPDAADEMLNDYSEFIVLDNYLARPRNNDYVSSILEPNGKIIIDGVELVLEEAQKNESANKAAGASSSGWVATGYDNLLVVTFESKVTGTTFLNNKWTNYVKNGLAGWIWNGSTYVLFPCHFGPNVHSQANYGVLGLTNTSFPTGYAASGVKWKSSFIETTWAQYASTPHGNVGGSFAFPNGQGGLLWIAGATSF